MPIAFSTETLNPRLGGMVDGWMGMVGMVVAGDRRIGSVDVPGTLKLTG